MQHKVPQFYNMQGNVKMQNFYKRENEKNIYNNEIKIQMTLWYFFQRNSSMIKTIS